LEGRIIIDGFADTEQLAGPSLGNPVAFVAIVDEFPPGGGP
jgi:hypothetical protein